VAAGERRGYHREGAQTRRHDVLQQTARTRQVRNDAGGIPRDDVRLVGVAGALHSREQTSKGGVPGLGCSRNAQFDLRGRMYFLEVVSQQHRTNAGDARSQRVSAYDDFGSARLRELRRHRLLDLILDGAHIRVEETLAYHRQVCGLQRNSSQAALVAEEERVEAARVEEVHDSAAASTEAGDSGEEAQSLLDEVSEDGIVLADTEEDEEEAPPALGSVPRRLVSRLRSRLVAGSFLWPPLASRICRPSTQLLHHIVSTREMPELPQWRLFLKRCWGSA